MRRSVSYYNMECSRSRPVPFNVEYLLFESFLLQKCHRHEKNINFIKNASIFVLTHKKATNRKISVEPNCIKRKSQIQSNCIKKNRWSPDVKDTICSLKKFLKPGSLESSSSCVSAVTSEKNKKNGSVEVDCCKENLKTSEWKKKRGAESFECLKDHINTTNNGVVLQKDLVKDKKTWECPICFDQSKGQEVVTTLCGHVFCKNCIEEYLGQVNIKKCPTCRFYIDSSNLITLYNL